MHQALLLARTSRSVTMIVRRGVLRASRSLATRVLEHPNMASAARSAAAGPRTAAAAKARRPTPELSVRASAAFVSIGHEPNTGLLRGQLGTF